jgi:hypothetical protein
MAIFTILSLFLLMACASYHQGDGTGGRNYAPAAIGPQMDLQSLRNDGLNRSWGMDRR